MATADEVVKFAFGNGMQDHLNIPEIMQCVCFVFAVHGLGATRFLFMGVRFWLDQAHQF